MQVALLTILAIILSTNAQAQTRSLPDITIRTDQLRPSMVKLCSPPLLSRTLASWRPNLKAALLRIREGAYGVDRAFDITVVPKSECKSLAEHACFGKPDGTVFCNEAVLARVLYSAAALAGARVMGAMRRANAGTQSGNLWANELRATDSAEFGPMEAFGLIDAEEEDATLLGVRAPGELTKLQQRLRLLERAYGPRGREVGEIAMAGAGGVREIDTNPSVLKTLSRDEALVFDVMLHIYRAGVDQALAFVLGHELAHAHGGCAAKAKALAPVENRVRQFIELQLEERLFCPNPPSPSEINADRCGLVALRAMNDYWQRRERLTSIGWLIKPGFQDLGNRLAIDLLGIMIVGGLGDATQKYYLPDSRPGRIDYWPKLKENEGYLYSALRLLLATEVLHIQSHSAAEGVRACGTTAQRVMEGLLRATLGCKRELSLQETGSALEKMNLPLAPGAIGVFTGSRFDTRCYR
jgi:hypothetical protein